MDKIRNKITNLKSKFNQIKIEIKSYLLSSQSFGEFIKTIKQMNIISIDLDEIYFGFTNLKRHCISMINCIILWMAVLVSLFIFC